MKTISLCLSLLCLGILGLPAQQDNEVQKLRRELKEAKDNFEKALQQHQAVIDDLSKRLEAVQAQQLPRSNHFESTPVPAQVTPAFVTKQSPAPTQVQSASDSPGWSPSQPITLARSGPAYMNISFDALLDAGWSTESDVSKELEQGHHDPLQRGFSIRNAEIALDGAVDPYFKGFANIAMALDKDNDTELELEEAYLLSTSLPYNFQAKAGQMFAEFGRQNPTHPHTWAFVDQPLVVTRFLGPDALRNPGAQLSWLAPTAFYLETFLGIYNGQGEQGFSFRNRGEPNTAGNLQFAAHEAFDRHLRGPWDLLYVPRVATSFDLTPQQTLVAGTSAAFGPNDTGGDARTEIYGVDLYWKWKSPKAHAGFPFVSLQTEGMYRRFEAESDLTTSIPQETLQDWGFYSQVLWGFQPRWVAGLRGEYANGNESVFDPTDRFRGERSRVSTDITWYPSEFSKLRLQYNYDHGEYFGSEHSVWMQVEFLLGAHGAHKF